jgi:hypothetical protein
VLLAGCVGEPDRPGRHGAGARTEERGIAAVPAVELAAKGRLTLTTGPEPRLRITARTEILGHLTSEIRNSRLVLGQDRAALDSADARYDLVLPAAREVHLSGRGTLRAAGDPIPLDTVEVSGRGDVRVTGLVAERLTVRVSGSGTASVAGLAAREDVVVHGPGRYDGRAVASDTAAVAVEGSGSAAVQVSQALHAVVEGSGRITYRGDAVVTGLIAGTGRIATG